MKRLLHSLIIGLSLAAAGSQVQADWVWSHPKPQNGETAWFRKTVELKGSSTAATLSVTADNAFAVYFNGRLVGISPPTGDWQTLHRYDVKTLIRPGRNVIAVRARNDSDAAGMHLSLTIKDGDKSTTITSDASWQARRNYVPRWERIDGPGSGWGRPHVFGPLGETEPWGDQARPSPEVSVPVELVKRPARPAPFDFVDGDRVVLLGSTFIERAQRYGWLETVLQLRFPNRRFSVRNLGWSGDTVFGESRGIFDPPAVGYGRMIEQVRELSPTVILINYGNNESFAGKEGLERFLQGYNQLIDDLSLSGADIALVSPHAHFRVPPPLPDPAERNENLARYSTAIAWLAGERGLHYADFWKLTAELSKKISGRKGNHLTDDGIQFNGDGYQFVSWLFVESLFGPGHRQKIVIDASKPKLQVESGGRTQVKRLSGGVRIALEQGAPLARSIRVAGLPGGKYAVRVNDQDILYVRLDQSKPLDDYWTRSVSSLNPYYHFAPKSLELMRDRIISKNEMYFHRWRPQNITYLFGFRRHEQGNNAREVAEFEAIVSGLEKQISDARGKVGDLIIDVVPDRRQK